MQNKPLAETFRLIARHGTNLTYTPGLGWLEWRDGHWQRDQDGAIMRCAKDTVRAIYREAADQPTRDEREKLSKHAAKSESHGALRALCALAESDPRVVRLADTLDPDQWLLNCANLAVDLRSGDTLPHDRAHYATRQAPVRYDPDAEAPTFARFLADRLTVYVIPHTLCCRWLQCTTYPGPSNTLPGNIPVILPPSITGTPLTRTYCMPTDSWLGFS